MPYIPEEVRYGLAYRPPLTPGELNFLISELVDGYVQTRGLSYDTLNSVIGVMECAKLELYRRLAAPYEDKKLAENGDVYTLPES